MTAKPALSPEARAALMACFATRGKRKGRLLSKAPRDLDAAAAWQGAMLACNPFKASIAAMMFARPAQQEITQEVMNYIEARPALARVCDWDRDVLETLGVW